MGCGYLAKSLVQRGLVAKLVLLNVTSKGPPSFSPGVHCCNAPPIFCHLFFKTLHLSKCQDKEPLGLRDDHPYYLVERLFPRRTGRSSVWYKGWPVPRKPQSHYSLAPTTDQACDMEGKVIIRKNILWGYVLKLRLRKGKTT